MRILLPSDGSPASLNAARYVAQQSRSLPANVLLLNVQRVYVDAEMLHAGRAILDLHRDEGEAALREAGEVLAQAGVDYEAKIGFGPVAEVIARTAKEARCEAIVIGTRARHPLVELLTRSVPARVVRRSELPVVLVKDKGR